MPKFACYSCGRSIWATVPWNLLFADERHCRRCGAELAEDRREQDRRSFLRRQGDQGPPAAGERRVADRRVMQRRREAVW